MEKQEQSVPNARRHVLHMAVANILNGHGFKKADKECIESLTEVCIDTKRIFSTRIHSTFTLLTLFPIYRFVFYRCCNAVRTIEHFTPFNGFITAQSLSRIVHAVIIEIAHSSKSYAELSGRTQPFLGDIVVSLVNLGISMKGITTYIKRHKLPKIPAPQPISATKPLSLLSAGTKQSLPSHIPNHFPPLPDPHAYVRTSTHKQPVTEYEAIREKAASQKRDIEKALTRYLAKTSDTDCLFSSEDNQMFPRE